MNWEELYKLEVEKNKVLSEKFKAQQYLYEIFDKYVITSTTDAKGIITEVSDAFVVISGYSREELIGHTHSMLRHPDMPDSVYKDLWKTITSKEVWRGVIKNQKKSGDYYWVDSTIIPLIDNENKIFGYKSIRIDITKSIDDEEIIDTLVNIDANAFDFDSL